MSIFYYERQAEKQYFYLLLAIGTIHFGDRKLLTRSWTNPNDFQELPF